MYRDEIITEVWRQRDAYVEEHHSSLGEIVEDLERRQRERSSSKLLDRRSKKAAPQPARTSARG